MGAHVRRLYAGMFQSTSDDRGKRRRVRKPSNGARWRRNTRRLVNEAGRAVNRRRGPSPRRLAMAVELISRPFQEW